MSTKQLEGFFAYPSQPIIAETIRNGVDKINQLGLVKLKSWESCKTGGKLVITEICREIDRADIFCADLTGLNLNVMFELGYAVARNKRIWVVIDKSVIETESNFAKLKMLTTVGYTDYRNSDDLRAKFISEDVAGDVTTTIFNQCIKPSLSNRTAGTVLYLKSRHMSEASTIISKEVEKIASAISLSLIIDDPRETAVQSLAWYAEQASAAQCAIIHLLNPSREGALIHNTKYAFVAGLAHGLEKPILMLADGDFTAPLDYRDMLKLYLTATEAERYLHQWSAPIIERTKLNTLAHGAYLAHIKLAQTLTELNIGEPIAENESDRLVSEYFVETNAYREALNGRQAIFVGRKGAGKSATFFKLASTLGADRRNLVCVIKPLAYEMQGIVELLQRYLTANLRSYAIESVWKFLVYSEIALAVEKEILERPSEQIHDHERDLIAVLDQNNEMLRQDISVRLERCIAALLNASRQVRSETIEEHRTSIAEALHAGIIRKLREVLVEALGEKYRVVVLVDNLDKAWDRQSDIEILAEFLLGLLGATSRITADFRDVGIMRRTIRVTLAVFLRADIFYRVIAHAREPDKIVYSKLVWSDDETLLSIVEERFATLLGAPPSDVWAKYFCADVKGIPTRSYFVSRVLKRPRDLLVFVKAAITVAVNRRHSRVEEVDIVEAEKQYSQFAVDSILVENGVSLEQLETVLYEFAGSSAVLDEAKVRTIVAGAGIPEEKVMSLIQLLCNLTFMGVEVRPEEFRFADDQSESHKYSVLAQRLVREKRQIARYKINPAFWAFLEVDGSS